MRKLIMPVFVWLWGAGLPVLLIMAAAHIARALGSDYAAQICLQIREQPLAPAYIPALICGAACLLVRRKWFTMTMAIVAPIIGLLLTKVNAIPVFTIVKIALEYLRLGAF